MEEGQEKSNSNSACFMRKWQNDVSELPQHGAITEQVGSGYAGAGE